MSLVRTRLTATPGSVMRLIVIAIAAMSASVASSAAAQGLACTSVPGNPNCSPLTSDAGLTTADAASLTLVTDQTSTRIYKLTKPGTLDILFTYYVPGTCSGPQVSMNRAQVGVEDRPGHMKVTPIPLTANVPPSPMAQRKGISSGKATASTSIGIVESGHYIFGVGMTCQLPDRSTRSATGVRLEVETDFRAASKAGANIPIKRLP